MMIRILLKIIRWNAQISSPPVANVINSKIPEKICNITTGTLVDTRYETGVKRITYVFVWPRMVKSINLWKTDLYYKICCKQTVNFTWEMIYTVGPLLLYVLIRQPADTSSALDLQKLRNLNQQCYILTQELTAVDVQKKKRLNP